jgi:hypothetical protein
MTGSRLQGWLVPGALLLVALIGMGGGVFTATATYGTKEPSGCLVAG